MALGNVAGMVSIHRTAAKHQPVGRDGRKLFLYRVDNVKGRVGTTIEDAAEGGGRQLKGVGKLLLGQPLGFHNLLNSVLHFLLMGLRGPKMAIFIRFTKLKHFFRTNNKSKGYFMIVIIKSEIKIIEIRFTFVDTGINIHKSILAPIFTYM